MDALGRDHALLDKELNLQNIIRNILMCNKTLELAKDEKKEPVITPRKFADLKSSAVVEGHKCYRWDDTEEEDCLRIPWGRYYTEI